MCKTPESDIRRPEPFTSSIMSATAWTPVLRGRRLEPCKLISHLVKSERVPEAKNVKDIPWTVKSISAELQGAPAIREQLIDSVVGIWRLREVEQESPFDTIWQDHLEAWLASHCDC